MTNNKRIIVLIISFIFIISVFCSENKDDKKNIKKTDDPLVVKNILDEALQKVNTHRSKLWVPRFEERDYHFICRLPIIDSIMNNPFTFPDFWEKFGINLEKNNKSFENIFDFALKTINDNVIFTPDEIKYTNVKDKESYIKLIETLAPKGYIKTDTILFYDKPNSKLYELAGKVTELSNKVSKLRNEAYKDVNQEDYKYLLEDSMRYFFKGKNYTFLTVLEEDIKNNVKIVNIFRKVDFSKLFEAEKLLIRETEKLLPLIRDLKGEVSSVDGAPILKVKFPFAKIIIGSSTDNTYEEGADVIIDLGGNDFYKEGIGTSEPLLTELKQNKKDEMQKSNYTITGFSYIIDIAGNDTYQSKTLSSQGSGLLGISFLYDEEGLDVYSGYNHCQGSAYGGVGILIDKSGNDKYLGNYMTQGAGLFGIGLLIDYDGDDLYQSSGFAQGFAGTMGMGLLYDVKGKDTYQCGKNKPADVSGDNSLAWGNGQGSAISIRSYPWLKDYSIYGGIGFLVDDKGDDLYEAQTFSQGASYLMSTGALLDKEGNDFYNGLGSHHQGGGIHLCSGILIDLKGNDKYKANNSSQGSGNDRTVSYCIDKEGDDDYYSKGNSQAYSRKGSGIGILVDYKGNDKYKTEPNEGKEKEELGQAYAQLGSEPFGISTVVFLDLDGNDEYNLEKRENNKEWQLQPGVIGIDADAKRMEKFKNKNNLFDKYKKLQARTGFDPFSQFHDYYKKAVPTDEKKFDDWIQKWIKSAEVNKDELVYYPMEQINDLFIQDKLSNKHIYSLAKWLKHKNPIFRAFTAKILGKSNVEDLGKELQFSLETENDAYVRKFVIEAIGRLGIVEAQNKIIHRISKDESEACKYYALIAFEKILKKHPDKDQYLVFVNALEDKSASIRFTAAKMLAKLREQKAIKHLIRLKDDKDVYVRRAVAHALMACGDIRGIPIIIDTMDFYSLDNSYYSYGRDIGNLLKQYTNHTFYKLDENGKPKIDKNGKKVRDYLNKEKWEKWWKEQPKNYSILQYVEAARLLDEGKEFLRDKKHEEAKAKFKEALDRIPGYLRAEEELEALKDK